MCRGEREPKARGDRAGEGILGREGQDLLGSGSRYHWGRVREGCSLPVTKGLWVAPLDNWVAGTAFLPVQGGSRTGGGMSSEYPVGR